MRDPSDDQKRGSVARVRGRDLFHRSRATTTVSRSADGRRAPKLHSAGDWNRHGPQSFLALLRLSTNATIVALRGWRCLTTTVTWF
jgi:hypothetical protein